MSGLRRTSVLVLVLVLVLAGGIMLLTGCQDTVGTGSAAGTGPSSANSANSSAPAAVGTSAPATSPSAGPAGTSTPSRGPATGSPDGASAPAGRSATPLAGCRNLAAGDGVKAEVTRVYRHDVTHFEHIGPVPHLFFYGRCGTVRYAATRFQPVAGATQAELVGMQDEGSVTKYFRDTGAGWVYVATDGLPPGPHGCGDIPEIPHALATAWGNCSIAR
ncbi:hypothetical protein ACH4S8_22645 [Streptomyces sp. NPDC021080]|uniref:hypothetical protein n=1 Tax=Streptomyces sp. NPDC021080 TaxID=3365110 RepID=UPI00378863BF